LITKPECFTRFKDTIYPNIIYLCFGCFAFSIFIYLHANFVFYYPIFLIKYTFPNCPYPNFLGF